MTSPGTITESPTNTRMRIEPLWKVLLHNDDFHAMDYVVAALVKAVPGLDTEEALRIMFEAHFNDVGLVRVCPREEAEYYQERIQTFGSGCSIEPDD